MILALTFDDLPIHETIPATDSRRAVVANIIDVLIAHRAPVSCGFANTALAVDDRSASTHDLLSMWSKAGFVLGNHTAHHLNLHRCSVEAFLEDVDQCTMDLQEFVSGTPPAFFRYPYLAEGETPEKRATVSCALLMRRLVCVRPTVNFGDWIWNCAYAECMAARRFDLLPALEREFLAAADSALHVSSELARRLFGREIPHVLLLHAGAFTARALARLLQLFQRRAVTLVTTEEAVRHPAYSKHPDADLASGYTWLHQLAESRGMSVTPGVCEGWIREARKEIRRQVTGSVGSLPPMNRSWRSRT